MEFLDLGCGAYDDPTLCPNNPDDPHYLSNQRVEAKAYILGLVRKYGAPPLGVSFRIRTNPHDFGPYISVECRFVEDDSDAVDYAYRCESGFERWEDVGLVLELVKGHLVVTDLRESPKYYIGNELFNREVDPKVEPCLDHTRPPSGAD